MPTLSITYSGYSFFKYRYEGVQLFVDPAFSVYDQGDWVRRWQVEPCDYVLVTHRHFDHFLDAMDVMEESEAVLVGAPFLCDYVRRRLDLPRERTLPLRSGERARCEQFRVEAVDADHPGFRALWPELMRRPAELLAMMRTQSQAPISEAMQSFVLEFGGFRIHHHGEGLNELTHLDELEALAERSPPDVVVCAADIDETEELAEAVEILQPKVVLIYTPHADIYRSFRIRSLPLTEFEGAIKAACPSTQVIKIAPDQRFELTL